MSAAEALLKLGDLLDARVAVAADDGANSLQLVPAYRGADAAQLFVQLIAFTASCLVAGAIYLASVR
jgi:hypothetical protein